MRLSDGGFFFFLESAAKYTAGTGSSLCFDVGRVGSLLWLHFHPLWVMGGGSVISSRKRGAGWMTHILLELNQVCLTQFRLFFFNDFCLEYEAKDCCLCVRLNSCNLQLLRCGVSHYSGRPLQSILRISLHILTVKRSKFAVNTFSCATMKTYQSD